MENVLTKKAVTTPTFKEAYDNFIGGKWLSPVKGLYFENISPVNGKVFTKVARSTAEDVELALDAAHNGFLSWCKTSATDRSNLLLQIADIIDTNADYLARCETWDNGKPIRETLYADLPLCADHFRYFAGVLRAEEGSMCEIDTNTVSMNVKEPLGVVAQIIPWNFPLLMACWKLAPALAAGNCVILKPAEQTPTSVLCLVELLEDVLPAGVLNVINGFGPEAGKSLASSSRINKIAFTGETTTGRLIMQYAAQNLVPVSLELGGKSPNIFFSSIMSSNDDFLQKCIEGATMFAFNQGEVCTCPSRILVQEDIYDEFIHRVLACTENITFGHPLSPTTMMGAQVSSEQYERILNYIEMGKQEGAEVLTGGSAHFQNSGLEKGFYIKPTIFRGHNNMRIFQEEIFGPVACVTTFKTEEEAVRIANDTVYGLGAGVWTRDQMQAYRVGRTVEAGRVWINNYHSYPAHAPFGGCKQSGFGRETHASTLDNYRQTKNLLISYDTNPVGLYTKTNNS